ncbi:MAG: hypothetical protein Q9168_002462 [Polycauliona sp. 1 TL-2023]
MHLPLSQEDSNNIRETQAGLSAVDVSGKASDSRGISSSDMNTGTTWVNSSSLAEFMLDADGGPIDNRLVLPSIVEVRCSYSPVIAARGTRSLHYALVFLDVKISVRLALADDDPRDEPSTGLRELLDVVRSDVPLALGQSWSGRALLVLPARSGYLARNKCFQQRFTGCADLGILHDRTVVGQHLDPVHNREIPAMLDSCVLMVVRSESHFRLSSEATVTEEVHARVNFPWLLSDKPAQKTLALIDGHLNLPSYLPLYRSATALGIKVVVLDRPGHWISDPAMQYLYQDFIPIDMTVDDGFPLRIAAAVEAYGNVDGLCSIASACLAPVAKAAVVLGLPTESPAAIALASNKHQTRLVAGGATPTTVVTNVLDMKHQLAHQTFIPHYPLIVKPTMGAGSNHVYKVDTETELLKKVDLTSQDSGKSVLVEAYVDGPELDVNFALLDGEIVFFEIADDLPSPGDLGVMDGDFCETANILPSALPADEYAIVRQELHSLMLRIGLKTGVFHLEARVQNSSMVFNEKDGLVDLRPRSRVTIDAPPRCVLIEINPRPPGFDALLATVGAYGVNMYDLHVLSALGEYGRFRALAEPFEPDTAIQNHARVWRQISFFGAGKGGICSSDDVCGDVLRRLSPNDRVLVTESLCFFRRGQRIPEPKPGAVLSGAFFIVTSGKSRHDVLRVSRALQQEFSIPVQPL